MVALNPASANIEEKSFFWKQKLSGKTYTLDCYTIYSRLKRKYPENTDKHRTTDFSKKLIAILEAINESYIWNLIILY